MRIYDLAAQKLLKALTPGLKWISSMDLHPSGDHLIVGGYDRKLCWFDLELSTKPYKVLRYVLFYYFLSFILLQGERVNKRIKLTNILNSKKNLTPILYIYRTDITLVPSVQSLSIHNILFLHQAPMTALFKYSTPVCTTI